MRTDQRADWRQRWLIIYNALVEPRPAEEIARYCGVSKATVHAAISRYNRLGVAAIETLGRGGRRRQYLTLEEEKAFLVMQVDGAGWHRANDLVVPENIRLISQPTYSLELNPVEHIWEELREKYFHPFARMCH